MAGALYVGCTRAGAHRIHYRAVEVTALVYQVKYVFNTEDFV